MIVTTWTQIESHNIKKFNCSHKRKYETVKELLTAVQVLSTRVDSSQAALATNNYLSFWNM